MTFGMAHRSSPVDAHVIYCARRRFPPAKNRLMEDILAGERHQNIGGRVKDVSEGAKDMNEDHFILMRIDF